MSEPDRAAAARLLGLIDLTSLNDAHDDDVATLCRKALTRHGPVAAVCSWPEFAADMAGLLAGQSPAVAVVANFPNGSSDAAKAAAEAGRAVGEGADEIDLVWPYRAWLAGEHAEACDLVSHVKAAVGGTKLKVILETGALGEPETIGAAGAAVIEAGADTLKTSTGKIAQGASLAAARAMLEAIQASRKEVGFKAAGGIRSVAEANAYLSLAEDIMGAGWATPARFRIGASRLLDEVLAVLD